MALRWFQPIAAALALTALVAAPATLPAATKGKAPAPAKAAPQAAGTTTPSEPVLGPIDTQAKHAFILEAETGTVLGISFSDQTTQIRRLVGRLGHSPGRMQGPRGLHGLPTTGIIQKAFGQSGHRFAGNCVIKGRAIKHRRAARAGANQRGG